MNVHYHANYTCDWGKSWSNYIISYSPIQKYWNAKDIFFLYTEDI